MKRFIDNDKQVILLVVLWLTTLVTFDMDKGSNPTPKKLFLSSLIRQMTQTPAIIEVVLIVRANPS